MAGALYKLTHTLGADVDLALVTDGSGGFHYAMIGEAYYGVPLHYEEAARQNLPAIRKEELRGAARVLGLRDLFFLDAYDHEYTTDVDTVLGHVWDAGAVRDSLRALMARGRYDFVLGLLPTEETHGHHKGATILALEAAAALPAAERPAVLGADDANAEDLPSPDEPPYPFTGLAGYPVTRVDPGMPVFRFDRLQPMEEDGVVNYKLVVNWALAEHKSQGDLAGYFNRGDYEFYWFFAANDPEKLDDAAALFARLDHNEWR
jgi:LmbE family N-acetylglucosaminyl deacetylase